MGMNGLPQLSNQYLEIRYFFFFGSSYKFYSNMQTTVLFCLSIFFARDGSIPISVVKEYVMKQLHLKSEDDVSLVSCMFGLVILLIFIGSNSKWRKNSICFVAIIFVHIVLTGTNFLRIFFCNYLGRNHLQWSIVGSKSIPRKCSRNVVFCCTISRSSFNEA